MNPELLYSSSGWPGIDANRMQMTLTAGMVSLYRPEESVSEVVPSRGALKLPDRSPGQDFSTVPESTVPLSWQR